MSRMRAALLAEHRKLVSTRIWWILALAMAGYLAFIGGVLALSATVTPPGEGAPQLGGIDAALSTYGVINAIGYVFPLVVGTLAVTTEHRHRTIEQTYLAEPRRGVVLVAKLLARDAAGHLVGGNTRCRVDKVRMPLLVRRSAPAAVVCKQLGKRWPPCKPPRNRC